MNKGLSDINSPQSKANNRRKRREKKAITSLAPKRIGGQEGWELQGSLGPTFLSELPSEAPGVGRTTHLPIKG